MRVNRTLSTILCVGLASCTTGPRERESYLPLVRNRKVFESQGKDLCVLEAGIKETDVGGREPLRTWTIEFPCGRDRKLHLVLMDVGGTTRIVIVAYQHGGIAPGSLRFFPPPEHETGAWTEESKVREVEGALMSIHWFEDHTTVETGRGAFDARSVELRAFRDETWIPLLRLWLARGEGIVQFECDAEIWTLEE